MPVLLNDNMSEKEILFCVLDFYADKRNWENYEKDMGDGVFLCAPVALIDQGEYARGALKILKK